MESYDNRSADSYLTREDEKAEDARLAARADMEADGLEFIDDDDASTDWQEYESWYDEGFDFPEDY